MPAPGGDVDTPPDGGLDMSDVKANMYFFDVAAYSGNNWLNLIPQNGNYAGNGANDAWIKGQAYVDIYGDGHRITKDAAGADEIRHIVDDYTKAHPNDDPLNMKIKDGADQNAFNHDLGALGGALSQVLNDVNFGLQQLVTFLTGDPSAYGLISAPFIAVLGSAYAAAYGVGSAVVDVGSGLWNAASDLASGFGAALSDAFSGNFGDIFDDIASGIGGAISAVGDALSSFFSDLFPVVIDMTGQGVKLISIDDSKAAIDLGNGVLTHTGWVGTGSAILAFDANHNGIVDGVQEFGLAKFAQGATSDLAGLAAFDSNHDGIFDAKDADWANFLIWQDKNGDGINQAGESMTLDQAGITSIALTLNGNGSNIAGNIVQNTTAVTFANGAVHQADDVSFAATNALGETSSIDLHSHVTTIGNLAIVTMDGSDVSLTVSDGMLGASANEVAVLAGAGTDNITVQSTKSAILLGGSGRSELHGNDAGDLFQAGAGYTSMFGGAGVDTFIVRATSGDAEIYNFGSNGEADQIVFKQAGFQNFDDFLVHSHQVGGDVIVDLASGHHLTIANTVLASLHAQEFSFIV